MASLESVKNGIPGEVFGKHTGQAASDAELTCAGPLITGTPFVPIAIAHHADTIVFFERIPQHPLEDAPAGNEFDERCKFFVHVLSDIRVSAADVRGDDDIVHVHLFSHAFEELIGGVSGCRFVLSCVGDLPMA